MVRDSPMISARETIPAMLREAKIMHSLNKIDDIEGEVSIEIDNIDSESIAKEEQYGVFDIEL